MTRVVLIGAHTEAEAPFAHLLAAPEAEVVAVYTLPHDALRAMSGGVDLEPLAAPHGVPTRRVPSINDAGVVTEIRQLEPDLLVVIGWTRLLSDELLRVPRIATLGFHASLLPKYRGRAPVNWAIINGERETGNTLMVLDPEADTGDIVAQRRIPIEIDDDCATVYAKVSATEVDMLTEALAEIDRTGTLTRRPQEHSEATVMPKRRPEDGLIDWSRTTAELHDWVRALTEPYPGAFTHRGSDVITIWRTAPPDAARDVPADDAPPVPGVVAHDAEGGVLVGTGDGWLRVLRAEIGTDERRPVDLAAGDRLGAGEA